MTRSIKCLSVVIVTHVEKEVWQVSEYRLICVLPSMVAVRNLI